MSEEPTVDGFTLGEWIAETRHVRDSLAALGVLTPACLPGEEKDCGAPVLEHYMTYLALLCARVAIMAQANLNEAQQAEYARRAQFYMNECEAEQGGEAAP